MSTLETILGRWLPKLVDTQTELTLIRRTLEDGFLIVKELARILEKRFEDVRDTNAK